MSLPVARAGLAGLLVLLVATTHADSTASGPGIGDEASPALSGFLLGRDADAIPEPVPPDRAFVLTAAPVQPRTLGLRFEIHGCCYLYRDKLRFVLTRADGSPIAAGGPRLAEVRLPPGAAMSDPYFGNSRVYRDTLDLRLRLRDLPANGAFLLQVTYQGCSEEGVVLCYEPMTRHILLRTVDQRLLVEGGAALPAS